MRRKVTDLTHWDSGSDLPSFEKKKNVCVCVRQREGGGGGGGDAQSPALLSGELLTPLQKVLGETQPRVSFPAFKQ